MKKVLLTGFAPFGGENVNPSWLAVSTLPDIPGLEIVKHELPVTFHGAAKKLAGLMDEIQPDYVVSLGQAAGRKAVTPELVAINLMNGTDADGVSMEDAQVAIGGENAMFSTLPVKEMVEAAKQAGVPAQRSLSAGDYVCNCVMYTALCYAKLRKIPAKCGFIHVPMIPEQTQDKPIPSLPLEEITKALAAMLACL